MIKILQNEELERILKLSIGSIILAIGVGWILGPVNLYASGVTGLLQIVIDLFKINLDINLNLGLLVLAANIPLLFLAFRSVSKKFMFYTCLSIIIQTVILAIPSPLPGDLYGVDILTRTLFGGILIGVGSGISLKIGGSAGGTDVLFQYLTVKKGYNFDKLNLFINLSIILITILIHYPRVDLGIYTTIRLIVTVITISNVNTSYRLVSVYVFTKKGKEVGKEIGNQLGRGVSIFQTKGAYTNENKQMILTIINRYQLKQCRKAIMSVDNEAFIKVSRADSVYGNYKKKTIV